MTHSLVNSRAAQPDGRPRLVGLARAVRRFRGEVRGAVTVEFAFVAPILLLMLIGLIEITRAVSIDSRLTVITSMVADLVAREKAISAEDVSAIYEIAELVMSPYDTGPLKMSLIPVRASRDDEANVRVYPVASHRPSYNGGAVPARCQPYSLSPGLLKEGTGLIVVEASYEYRPMFGSFILGASTWSERAIASPRNTGCVEFYDKSKSPSDREKVCVTSTCFSSS